MTFRDNAFLIRGYAPRHMGRSPNHFPPFPEGLTFRTSDGIAAIDRSLNTWFLKLDSLP